MPPSVATVIIEGRDRASDDIKQVIRSVDRLDTATRNVKGLDGGDLSRTMRGGAAAARDATTATSGLGGSLKSLGATAAGLAGTLGVAFGAQAIAGFASESVVAANSLEVTEARVKALSGSTQRYAQVLALAKAGQAAYGGTLEENISALGGFVNMSNRTGVAIDALDNAARRLAAADPAQGISGASVALREFLTGSGAEAVTSLAERFELPKDALTALADASVSTEQRMKGLDGLLNDMGYTNEFLAATADTSAKSFTDLATAFSNLKTTVGSGIATFIAPSALQTAKDLTYLTDNLASKAARQAEVFSNTSSYAAYAAAVEKVNSQYTGFSKTIDGFFLRLPELTQAQYAATQALVANGMAADEAISKVQALAGVEQQVASATGERRAALEAMRPQLLQAAAGSDTSRIAVESLIQAYASGQGVYASQIEADRLLTEGLVELIPQQNASAAAAYAQQLAAHGMTTAHQDAAYAAGMARQALEENTEAAVLNELQTQRNALVTDELRARLDAAAQAMLNSGDASEAAMQRHAELLGVDIELIRISYQLAAAANTAAAALDNQARAARAAMDSMQAQEILTRQGIDPTTKHTSRTDMLDRQYQVVADAQDAARDAAEKAAKAAQAAAKKTGAANKAAASDAEAAQKKAQREAERAQAEAERAAEELQKAQDDLLTNEERLAVYRERLAAGDLPEVERLRLMKEIRDLEESISNEQEKQRRAAIDAQLAAIDDRKQRREEAKEIAAAQRVLASSGTSEAQKAAARDVLERIPLEQAKRAQEIADTLEDAGQAAPPAELTTMPVGGPTTPVPVTIAQSTLPPIALPAAAALANMTFNATIVLPDGTVIGSGSATTPFGRDPITDLRLALRATGA